MNKYVELFEQDLKNGDDTVGKIGIFLYSGADGNPTPIINDAVYKYVETNFYNEFVEIELNNPYVRVVISEIPKLPFKPFTDQRL